MAKKMSKGRQKIQMTKMSKESNLLVTFSKRRSGLFKKASELCILCGVEIAIVVFSPGRKVFSFGHPNVESIVNRFLTRSSSSSSSNTSTTCQLVEAHRNANVRELNVQLMEILNQLELEKKREIELVKINKSKIGKSWWEGPVDELGLAELEQLKLGMEELKKNVTKQMQKIIFETSNTPAFFLGVGGSSSNGGQVVDVKNFKGLGLSMATNGHTIFP